MQSLHEGHGRHAFHRIEANHRDTKDECLFSFEHRLPNDACTRESATCVPRPELWAGVRPTSITITPDTIQRTVTKASLTKAYCCCAVSSATQTVIQSPSIPADGYSRLPFASALSGSRRIAASERHAGAVAKVSYMSGGLCHDGNRSCTFGVNRDIPEQANCDPVFGVAVIRCVKTGATLCGVDIQNGRNSIMKATARSMVGTSDNLALDHAPRSALQVLDQRDDQQARSP